MESGSIHADPLVPKQEQKNSRCCYRTAAPEQTPDLPPDTCPWLPRTRSKSSDKKLRPCAPNSSALTSHAAAQGVPCTGEQHHWPGRPEGGAAQWATEPVSSPKRVTSVGKPSPGGAPAPQTLLCAQQSVWKWRQWASRARAGFSLAGATNLCSFKDQGMQEKLVRAGIQLHRGSSRGQGTTKDRGHRGTSASLARLNHPLFREQHRWCPFGEPAPSPQACGHGGLAQPHTERGCVTQDGLSQPVPITGIQGTGR